MIDFAKEILEYVETNNYTTSWEHPWNWDYDTCCFICSCLVEKYDLQKLPDNLHNRMIFGENNVHVKEYFEYLEENK